MAEDPTRDRFTTLRRLVPVLRWRYPILLAAAFGFSFQHLSGTGEDWQFFVRGSDLLFGVHGVGSPLAGGLHLYANYPELQIGPLSFLVAGFIRLVGPGDGRVLAALVMTPVAPALVFVAERAARAIWADRDERSDVLLSLTALLGGILVVQAWSPLATIYAHLDDVLVLAAATGAIWAVGRRRSVLVGVCIGLAVAAKPWGIVALPLVLALPRREAWKALAPLAAITAAAWLPFVIADSSTLDAVKPAVITAPASVLHLFGVPLTDGPAWVRPVQLGASLVAGALAVWRRRWGAVLLVGVAVRIALDPQTFLYYSAGLVVAALLWDLLRSPHPLPVWTLVVFLLLNDAYVVVGSPEVRAAMRLVITALIIAIVLLWRQELPGSVEGTGGGASFLVRRR